MVAYLKLQHATGSHWWAKTVTSGAQSVCGSGQIWQLTWWFLTGQNSGPIRKRRKEWEKRTTHQTTDVCWGVTLLVTVLRCDLGQAREHCLDWLLLIWRDIMPGKYTRGWGGGHLDQSPPFILTLLLYLSFSHIHAHKHPQCVPFIPVFLALSILSVLPCCHPLSYAP